MQVEELLERGVYDMKELAEGGWLTALRYEDEVIADLKKRTGGKADKVRAVRSGPRCMPHVPVTLAAPLVVPPEQPHCLKGHGRFPLCRLA